MKRNDPGDQVVQFFETASPETARVVFGIVKGIVARRAPEQPKVKRLSAARVTQAVNRAKLPADIEQTP